MNELPHRIPGSHMSEGLSNQPERLLEAGQQHLLERPEAPAPADNAQAVPPQAWAAPQAEDRIYKGGSDHFIRLKELREHGRAIRLGRKLFALDETVEAPEPVDFITKSEAHRRDRRDLFSARQEAHELRARADLHPLTKLPNKLKLEETLESLVEQGDTDFAVVFLDLEGFKAINDKLGHLEGNKKLEAFANRLRELVRDEDLVTHFGGDEFAIIARHLKQDAKEPMTQTEREEKMTERFRTAATEAGVSTSVGIAFANGELSAHQLLDAADKKMYQDKQQRKSQMRPER